MIAAYAGKQKLAPISVQAKMESIILIEHTIFLFLANEIKENVREVETWKHKYLFDKGAHSK